MIQFNLLPDVKLEYLKAERLRKLVIAVSALVTLAALVVMLALLSVTILQRKHLSDLNKDIKSQSSQLEGQADLNKILTVQNQLGSLTDLHSAKPAASRLTDYMKQLTPSKAAISSLNIDFNQHTLNITGTADSLATVNQYIDTLKFTTYKADDGTSQNAFSSVVLASFGLTTHEADYNITFSYDPTIFEITKSVTLTVPNIVTTRSETEQPSDLFKLPVDNPASSTNKGQ